MDPATPFLKPVHCNWNKFHRNVDRKNDERHLADSFGPDANRLQGEFYRPVEVGHPVHPSNLCPLQACFQVAEHNEQLRTFCGVKAISRWLSELKLHVYLG